MKRTRERERERSQINEFDVFSELWFTDVISSVDLLSEQAKQCSIGTRICLVSTKLSFSSFRSLWIQFKSREIDQLDSC